MGMIDRVIAGLSPRWAVQRLQARTALTALMHYNAATSGNRGLVFNRATGDADATSSVRSVLAVSARDLVRNTPFATRAQQVIANNVVGDGIIWKVNATSKAARADMMRRLKAHFDTTAIDADGRSNLYGLQRLIMNAVVADGEVLVRRRRRLPADRLPLPFQVQVIEIDHLDTDKRDLSSSGPMIREGIEYDAIGRRVAYWLFDVHPGADLGWQRGLSSRRVPASEILHVYRQDRPGQMRGVSWFAPIALKLQDLDDYDDAQLMRQKVAACFAGFRVVPDIDSAGQVNRENGSILTDPAGLAKLTPGRIQTLPPGEDMRFTSPPGVEGYDVFTRGVLMGVAAAMGLTYESLTGDLSRVNFSSARMGRMEMDRNVSSWQWLLMIPQFLQPLTAWAMEAADVSQALRPSRDLTIDWVPPHRMLVDPAREIPAMIDEIRGGLASWQGQVRRLGYDPEDLLAEHVEDKQRFGDANLTFTSQAGVPVAQGQGGQTAPSGPAANDTNDDDPPGGKTTQPGDKGAKP